MQNIFYNQFTISMKKLNYLILVCLLFASCSDKYDSLIHTAPGPLLVLSADTIHVREKDYNNLNSTGVLWMHTIPAAKQFNITYSDTSGKVHFMYRGSLLKDSWPVIVAGDSTGIFVSCDDPGIYAVEFFLTDQLGRSTSRELIVACERNKPPIANLAVQFVDSTQMDNWMYKLDASGSSKPDGIIKEYHFSVNGTMIISTQPSMIWTFHERGMQKIELFVVDDLDEPSDTITQFIMIP